MPHRGPQVFWVPKSQCPAQFWHLGTQKMCGDLIMLVPAGTTAAGVTVNQPGHPGLLLKTAAENDEETITTSTPTHLCLGDNSLYLPK